MGNHENSSDIDLAVLGDLNLRDVNSLKNKLEDLYLPYKFDVINYKKIENDNLIDHIQRVGVVLLDRKVEHQHTHQA